MVKKSKNIATAIALVGIMAAILECVKFSLASIPNVEAITLVTAVFGYVFGPLGIIAAVVFVSVEPLIWGVGTWIISYYIHWPLVAFIFMLLGKAKIKNRIILTLFAVSLCATFGVLTSLVDIGLFMGNFENFFYRFGIYYARGISFYLTQIITNAILFPLLFRPITRALRKYKFPKN